MTGALPSGDELAAITAALATRNIRSVAEGAVEGPPPSLWLAAARREAVGIE